VETLLRVFLALKKSLKSDDQRIQPWLLQLTELFQKSAISLKKRSSRLSLLSKIDQQSTKKSKTGGENDGSIEYVFSYKRIPLVKVGDSVKKGDLLTDGSADIDEMFKYAGAEKAKAYVISEVGKIYELQGETVSRKHIEIIVKQMFSRRKDYKWRRYKPHRRHDCR
jgi:hypothetical protein